MKRILALVLIPLFAGSMLLAGCSSDEGDDGNPETREDYQAQAERRIDEIGREIDELEAEVRDSDASQELRDRLDSLKDERGELEDNLRDIQTAGEEEWRELRDNLDRSLEDLEEDLDSLGSELRNLF